MKRVMMQVYTKGSDRAVALYQEAFGAALGYNVKHPDGTYYHSELDVYGQILSVAERPDADANNPGNTMQFCLHFAEDEEPLIHKAFAVLREGAAINIPPGPCDFSPCMTDFVDRYGVRWCLFC